MAAMEILLLGGRAAPDTRPFTVESDLAGENAGALPSSQR
jgi:hypothetical protein